MESSVKNKLVLSRWRFRMEVKMQPFFLLLLEMSQTHASRSREGFQKLDLSEGQPKVLYILEKQDGHTQKELAEMCRIRPSTLTVMLDKMEKKNFIYKERTTVSGGKRAYQIYLTEEGREMAVKVKSLTDKLDSDSLRGFSDKEKEMLYDFMERIIENLEA